MSHNNLKRGRKQSEIEKNQIDKLYGSQELARKKKRKTVQTTDDWSVSLNYELWVKVQPKKKRYFFSLSFLGCRQTSPLGEQNSNCHNVFFVTQSEEKKKTFLQRLV